MLRRPPRSTLFPSPTLSRSPRELATGVSAQLQAALGYDRVTVTSKTPARAEGEDPRVVMCTIRESSPSARAGVLRSEEHTSELQSQSNLVCRPLLAKKKNTL